MIAGNKTTVNGSMNYYVQESPGVKRRCYAYDTKRYLLTALQCLRSLPIYEFQRKTLESAISNVQEAINDEEQFPTSAMSELKKVIGEL